MKTIEFLIIWTLMEMLVAKRDERQESAYSINL